MMRSVQGCAATCAVLVSALPLCSQVPTGSIGGIVRDPAGLRMRDVRVIVISQAQGTTRAGRSNADGSFALPNLQPGVYTVVLSASGFGEVRYPRVQVEAGKAITLDTTLTVSTTASVDVSTSNGAQVDLTQSLLQGQITSRTIESIPLNGRNFLELAYLIPGNRPAPVFDPTKTNTLEVSSVGGFGRGGNITIDGADNNDEIVGGTLSNLPQDAVAEFQIATARFTAQVGRSGNSIINVVTRSGTNKLHGSAFLFERNRHLQGLPATFDRSQPTPRFDRQQFGGSVGGPFVKDKLFAFSSVEYRNQHAALQTGTRVFASTAPYGRILNTAAPAPLGEALLANRVDYQADPADRFSLRYSFDRSQETARASASSSTPQSTAAERQNSLNRFNSAVASWTRVLGSSRVNELAFHYDDFYNIVPKFPQDGSNTNPQLNLTNELIFPDLADGANFNVPQSTRLNRFQLRDNFTTVLGKHTLHTGFEFQHYKVSGQINVFGSGTVILTSDFGFADLNGDGVVNDLDIPVAVGIKSSAPITPVPIPKIQNNYTGAYVQDDWRVLSRLTLNLGLRYEFDSNATGQSSAHAPCPTLTSIPNVPCTWMANILPLAKSPDKTNLGPRVGFVFDPFGRGTTAVRGGYGIYYDRIVLESGSKELIQNDRALTVTQYAGSSCSNPNIPAPPSLGLCFAPGSRFVANSPNIANAFSGSRQTGGVGIVALGPNTHHPLFQQFSLGMQQQAGNWLVAADGVHVFGNRLIIGQLLRSTTSTSPYVKCPGNNATCVITDPATGISDSVTILDSSAKSWYDGLLASVNHRPTTHGRVSYQYSISYTLSKTFDYSNDDQLENGNKDEQVNLVEGTAGLRREKGYSLTDERHRLTFYGEAKLPYGFSVAPIYTFGSGVPADTFVPGTASQRTGASGSRLPLLPRNALGREIKNSAQLNAVIDRWNALPACPVASGPCNEGGPLAHVPANVNYFSPFSSLDLRLQKAFLLHEDVALKLIGEGFNLFNQVNVRGTSNANFAGRNISLAAASSFQQANPIQTNFYQPVSTAGGFFGSGGARAFQLAVRLEF